MTIRPILQLRWALEKKICGQSSRQEVRGQKLQVDWRQIGCEFLPEQRPQMSCLRRINHPSILLSCFLGSTTVDLSISSPALTFSASAASQGTALPPVSDRFLATSPGQFELSRACCSTPLTQYWVPKWLFSRLSALPVAALGPALSWECGAAASSRPVTYKLPPAGTTCILKIFDIRIFAYIYRYLRFEFFYKKRLDLESSQFVKIWTPEH